MDKIAARIATVNLMALLGSYSNNLDANPIYSGWTPDDFKNVIGAACALIAQMSPHVDADMGLEPGEFIKRFSLKVQLDAIP